MSYGLMSANVPFETDKQNGSGEDPRLNTFTEDTSDGISLIHKLRGETKGLTRFSMGGRFDIQLRALVFR
jgi:hypothetical protein